MWDSFKVALHCARDVRCFRRVGVWAALGLSLGCVEPADSTPADAAPAESCCHRCRASEQEYCFRCPGQYEICVTPAHGEACLDDCQCILDYYWPDPQDVECIDRIRNQPTVLTPSSEFCAMGREPPVGYDACGPAPPPEPPCCPPID
jgi:hypothetical protein